MNIHEGECRYQGSSNFDVLFVGYERTDGLQQWSIRLKLNRPTHVAVVVLKARTNNLTNASG